MNPHVVACYSPAIVVAVYAAVAAGIGEWSRFGFLAVFACSIVAHIRYGR